MEFYLVQEDAEVLQERRRLPGLRRNLLELADGLRRAQDALGRVGGDLGRLGVLAVPERVVKLPDEELVGAAEVVAHREPERHVGVLQVPVDVVDDVLLIDGHGEHLTLAVDADDAVARLVRRRHEDGLGRNAIHVDADAALEVVEVDVSVLRDEIGHPMLLRYLWRTCVIFSTGCLNRIIPEFKLIRINGAP